MKYHLILSVLCIMLINGCKQKVENGTDNQILNDHHLINATVLSSEQANRLAELPIKCLQTEYPNKLGQVLGSRDDIGEPHMLHPAFYGCFDWHSSVHGHWSLVKLIKSYPDLDKAEQIRLILTTNISVENVESEVEYFEGEHNKTFERTYGWAWLLKLAEELESWDDPLGKSLSQNLKPLTDIIVEKYFEFLPKLKYPVRAGTHTNTAFGLCFAWDYAISRDIDSLKILISERSKDFYLDDVSCPLDWEPGGYDFLSPCLEEVDLMRRVLTEKEFRLWISKFLPGLKSPEFELEQGEVLDRTDGQLVHLDGLNFSRAWVLYGLAHQYRDYIHLKKIADDHIAYSLNKLTDGHYEGEHWLASFAIYALANAEN